MQMTYGMWHVACGMSYYIFICHIVFLTNVSSSAASSGELGISLNQRIGPVSSPRAASSTFSLSETTSTYRGGPWAGRSRSRRSRLAFFQNPTTSMKTSVPVALCTAR